MQAIAIDEDYATQDEAIIDAGTATAFGKERLNPRHLRVSQPEKIAHQKGLLEPPESSDKVIINGS